MLTYTLRRLLLAIPTVLGAATLIFVVLRLLPGDPAVQLAGPHASLQDVQRLRQALGTDQPIPVQYLSFLLGLLHGDLGASMTTRQPVLDEILFRLPYTLELAVVSIGVAAVVGVTLGTLAAVNQRSVVDVGISGLAIFGVSMPTFWLGLMLIVLFAIDLHVLPAGGSQDDYAWVLPSLTLAVAILGTIARMTRSSMLEVLRQDYIRTAWAKGAPRWTVILKHALRTALLPIITTIGLQFGYLLGGAVLVETVFSWPGVGRLLVDSIMNRNYPVIQGIVLTFSTLFIVVNLVVDLCYAYVDPRIRYD